jgi:hypothetical protein
MEKKAKIHGNGSVGKELRLDILLSELPSKYLLQQSSTSFTSSSILSSDKKMSQGMLKLG